jgi:hypothetical protein
MVILNSQVAVIQDLRFIPRGDELDYISLTDEMTGEVVEIETYTIEEGDYYKTLKAEFPIIENHFYMLMIKNGETIVYQDKIFCTDQPIVSFSVNNNQYTSNTTTNEFIVYE